MNYSLDRERPSTSQVWLDVVSAVDYLSQGHRPGLTVYDALEEALRWHVVALMTGDDDRADAGARAPLPWDDPDALRTALEQLALHQPPAGDEGSALANALHGALAHWVRQMADQYNDGRDWTHPTSDRGCVGRRQSRALTPTFEPAAHNWL